MGVQALRLLATLNPDYQIITSFTGLGDTTGARVLAEIGDDRARFADARSLKAYAGSAPVTRASGRSLSVTHRRIKNNRLAAAGFVWAFVAAAHSPGASTLYHHRREQGDRHAAALRNVFNRLLGCLYHCLQTGQTYSEAIAFPTSDTQPEPADA
jgi:transposase